MNEWHWTISHWGYSFRQCWGQVSAVSVMTWWLKYSFLKSLEITKWASVYISSREVPVKSPMKHGGLRICICKYGNIGILNTWTEECILGLLTWISASVGFSRRKQYLVKSDSSIMCYWNIEVTEVKVKKSSMRQKKGLVQVNIKFSGCELV